MMQMTLVLPRWRGFSGQHKAARLNAQAEIKKLRADCENHELNAQTLVCYGCGATEQQLAMAPRPRSRTAVCTDARCVCEGATLRCTRSDMLDGRYVFKGYA